MDLNQSLERSRIIYDPIINEIFDFKLSKSVKAKSLTSMCVSAAICFVCGFLIQKPIEFEFYSLILFKLMLTVIFCLFLLSLLYSLWQLLNSTSRVHVYAITKSLDAKHKQLLGVEDNDYDEKHGKTLDLRKRCVVRSPKHQMLNQTVESPKIPYFSLSPIKYQQATVQQVQQPQQMFTDRSFNDSMQLDRDRSVLFSPRHEQDSFLSNSLRNMTSDYGDERRHDKSIELRNNQYQIGTKSVQQSLATSKLATSQSADQNFLKIANLTKHDSFAESLDYSLTSSLLNLKSDVSVHDLSQHLLQAEAHLLNTQSTVEQMWCKTFGISRLKLDKERENLRKWISLTILKPLVTEIENINEVLSKLGCFDITIGQSSIAQLNTIQQQTNKINLLQTLTQVLPYLELTTAQDYLVKRLKELSITTCISDYHWNNGSSSKEWSDYLPTDAQILMHLFCVYMNSRLLPNPRYPNGKSFQMQYFFKNPQLTTSASSVLIKTEPSELIKQDDKTKTTQLDQQQDHLSNLQQQQQHHHLSSLYLYEFKSNPPHYKVVSGKDVFDVHQGRNNFFDSILCFLHIIKNSFNSSLGQVRLDSSGVNILVVLE